MVFGSTLVKVCENDRTLVPIFVTNCIKEVDSRGINVCVLKLFLLLIHPSFGVLVSLGLDIDGVYRISANLSQVQKLRHFVDQSGSNF